MWPLISIPLIANFRVSLSHWRRTQFLKETLSHYWHKNSCGKISSLPKVLCGLSFDLIACLHALARPFCYPRGENLWNNSSKLSSSARAHLSKNYDKTKRKRHRELHLNIIMPIQITWWCPREPNLSNFIIRTCKCKHKLWKDEGNYLENITWSVGKHDFIFCSYLFLHKLWKGGRKVIFKIFHVVWRREWCKPKRSISVGDSTDIKCRGVRAREGLEVYVLCLRVCFVPYRWPNLASQLFDRDCSCVVTQWGLKIWECCGGSSVCQ